MGAIALDPLLGEAQRRARRRRYLLAAAGVTAVGAVALTLAAHSFDGSSPAVIAAAACRPSQLRAEKPRFGGVYTAHVVESLGFVNVSGGSCSLAGWPSFIAVLPGGRRVAARVGHIRNVSSRGTVVPVGRIILRPGGAASFHLIAADGTGLETRCSFPLPSVRVLVVPPGASAPADGRTTMPYCHDPRRLLVMVSPVVPGRLDRYVF